MTAALVCYIRCDRYLRYPKSSLLYQWLKISTWYREERFSIRRSLGGYCFSMHTVTRVKSILEKIVFWSNLQLVSALTPKSRTPRDTWPYSTSFKTKLLNQFVIFWTRFCARQCCNDASLDPKCFFHIFYDDLQGITTRVSTVPKKCEFVWYVKLRTLIKTESPTGTEA